MKAADLLVKALEHEGVQYVFGLPGKENLDVLESDRRGGRDDAPREVMPKPTARLTHIEGG